MAWNHPIYKSEEYNLAGKVLVNGDHPEMNYDTALQVINNWRSSHYRPLNTFQRRLRRKALEVDGNSLVAQRIKRLYSIQHKIERFPTMRLTQIQDIGGCRAIVSTVEHLTKLIDVMASRDKNRSSRGLKHKLIDEKNYIDDPKPSGYRGVHQIFRYYSDKAHEHDGLKIEIQFRTIIQHAWATAVETVGIFIGQALKSSIGQQEWLDFFGLASSAFAAHEGTAGVPNIDFSPDELRMRLRHYSTKLDVQAHLRAYSEAINILEQDISNVQYYLLELDAANRSVKVTGYKHEQFEKAAADYLSVEKHNKQNNINAVLVSADSISTLKKAYPNYFVDTEIFLRQLRQILA